MSTFGGGFWRKGVIFGPRCARPCVGSAWGHVVTTEHITNWYDNTVTTVVYILAEITLYYLVNSQKVIIGINPTCMSSYSSNCIVFVMCYFWAELRPHRSCWIPHRWIVFGSWDGSRGIIEHPQCQQGGISLIGNYIYCPHLWLIFLPSLR